MTRRTYELPITPSDGILRIRPRIRERWLTPDVDRAMVQARGDAVSVWLWSDRRNVRVDVPLTEFIAEKPFTRSVRRWGVSVNRWLDAVDTLDTDDERLKVQATAGTHKLEPPEAMRS